MFLQEELALPDGRVHVHRLEEQIVAVTAALVQSSRVGPTVALSPTGSSSGGRPSTSCRTAAQRATGSLVLGVDQAAAGRGPGGGLVEGAATGALVRGLRRLELTGMTDDLRALALSTRCRFLVEGLRRAALSRGVVGRACVARRALPRSNRSPGACERTVRAGLWEARLSCGASRLQERPDDVR